MGFIVGMVAPSMDSVNTSVASTLSSDVAATVKVAVDPEAIRKPVSWLIVTSVVSNGLTYATDISVIYVT